MLLSSPYLMMNIQRKVYDQYMNNNLAEVRGWSSSKLGDFDSMEWFKEIYRKEGVSKVSINSLEGNKAKFSKIYNFSPFSPQWRRWLNPFFKLSREEVKLSTQLSPWQRDRMMRQEDYRCGRMECSAQYWILDLRLILL